MRRRHKQHLDPETRCPDESGNCARLVTRARPSIPSIPILAVPSSVTDVVVIQSDTSLRQGGALSLISSQYRMAAEIVARNRSKSTGLTM